MRTGTAVLAFSFPLAVLLALTGCSTSFSPAPDTPGQTAFGPIGGIVHGGRQPIVGAQVYAFQTSATGYGGASKSLITSASPVSGYTPVEDTTAGDATYGDYYVPTDSNGKFEISSTTTCTAGTAVYLYSVSGQPTTDITNPAAGLMAVLGTCPEGGTLLGAVTSGTQAYISMNELSTVAAAYALAGFATDAIHIGNSGTALANTGIQNAAANAAQMYTAVASSPGTSPTSANATTLGGNGTVPQEEIDTLANILASCVNSTGPSSASCTGLFDDAESDGTSGAQATDTATAAIYIAHHPGANPTALYNLVGSTASPFGPPLTAAPNDFTIALNFTGGGLDGPFGIAIDSSGNAWVANSGNSSISKFSSTGTGAKYTGGGLDRPFGIAIDSSGNAWVTNDGNSSISKFSSTGTGANYTGGGLEDPYGIAIDGSDNVWVTNDYGFDSISKFSNNGSALSGSGYMDGGLDYSYGIAVDGSGNVWVANYTDDISKFSNNGDAFAAYGYGGGGLDYSISLAIDGSGNVWVANDIPDGSLIKFSNSGAFSGSAYTGSGLLGPDSVAIDGSGNVWAANYDNDISEFSSTGTALSGSGGYTNSNLDVPYGITIDGSGDVWIANDDGNSVVEFMGAATPVITPICAGLPATPTANGTSSLGTRP